jgi:hypothetical protein
MNYGSTYQIHEGSIQLKIRKKNVNVADINTDLKRKLTVAADCKLIYFR